MKPIGYIFFPFLFLTIILWNINHKTFNFNKGISIKELLSNSIYLVRIAGNEVLKEKLRFKNEFNISKLNKISSKVLLTGLTNHFPMLKIISTEDPDHSLSYDYNFRNKNITQTDDMIHNDLIVSFEDVLLWINHLEGIDDYSDGMKYATISICITFQEHPIAAVIHHPLSNETYWIWLGYSKSKNLDKYSRKKSKDKHILISQYFGNSKIINEVKNLFNQAKVIALSGIGYKTILMINGSADYFYNNAPLHKCHICVMHVFIIYFKGCIFSWPKSASKLLILNRTSRNFRQIFNYSDKSSKWIPNIMCGIKI